MKVNAVKFREKNFQTAVWSGTRQYQAIVVLELEGCRIFSIEEIRQDLIDLLTVTITVQPEEVCGISG